MSECVVVVVVLVVCVRGRLAVKVRVSILVEVTGGMQLALPGSYVEQPHPICGAAGGGEEAVQRG